LFKHFFIIGSVDLIDGAKMKARRPLLLSLVAAAIIAGQCSGCALTPDNRFADRAQAAQVDLYSPAMQARIDEARR
jgi:hypothetical protein